MDWMKMWIDDKQGMISTMMRNLAADLDAGYTYFGQCVQKQKYDIEEYQKQYEKELMALADMDEKKANRWCYFDLLRRGVITR